MSLIRFKKILYKSVGILSLLVLLLSCRGISLAHTPTPSQFNHHPNCCDSGSEKFGTGAASHDISWGIIVEKNSINSNGLFNLMLLSFGVAVISIFSQKYKLYLRAIRDRYGSFVPLNYLTNLFKQGILNSKVI